MASVNIYRKTKGRKYKGDLRDILDIIKDEALDEVKVVLFDNIDGASINIELVKNELYVQGDFDEEGNIKELYPYLEGTNFRNGLDLNDIDSFRDIFKRAMKLREDEYKIEEDHFTEIPLDPQPKDVLLLKNYSYKKLKGCLRRLFVMLAHKSSSDIDMLISKTIIDGEKVIHFEGTLIEGKYYFGGNFDINTGTKKSLYVYKLIKGENNESVFAEYEHFCNVTEFEDFFVNRLNKLVATKDRLYYSYNLKERI